MVIEKFEKTLRNGKNAVYFSPTLEDCEAVLDFRNKSVKETDFLTRGIGDADATIENQIKRISDASISKTNFIVMAKVENQFVGLGQIYQKSPFLKFSHRCELGIFVAKSHWGVGIGTELMEILINNCKKLGYEIIELELIKENISALNLYKKFGFVEVGEIENGVKYADGTYSNLLYMQKSLKGVE